MSTLAEIETALQALSPEELAAFRAWFAEFDAAGWDRQLERDEGNGRLDELAAEALGDVASGALDGILKLNSSAVQSGMKDILLNHAGLWETLRARAAGSKGG